MPFFAPSQLTAGANVSLGFARTSVCLDRESPLLPGCARRARGAFVIRGSGVRVPLPADSYPKTDSFGVRLNHRKPYKSRVIRGCRFPTVL
jgi:hypothetical protein